MFLSTKKIRFFFLDFHYTSFFFDKKKLFGFLLLDEIV